MTDGFHKKEEEIKLYSKGKGCRLSASFSFAIRTSETYDP